MYLRRSGHELRTCYTICYCFVSQARNTEPPSTEGVHIMSNTLLDALVVALQHSQVEGTRRDTTDMQEHWHEAALKACESDADRARVARVRAGMY